MSHFQALLGIEKAAQALREKIDEVEVNMRRAGDRDLEGAVDSVHDALVDVESALDNIQKARTQEKEKRHQRGRSPLV